MEERIEIRVTVHRNVPEYKEKKFVPDDDGPIDFRTIVCNGQKEYEESMRKLQICDSLYNML